MAHSIQQQRVHNPMWLYEHNFATLSALFPGLILGNESIVQHESEQSRLTLQIREKNKYTLLLEATEQYAGSPSWRQALQMRIRLYTDAKLAEVVSYQGRARFLPKYDTPNPKMYQRDEKRQINHLLYDWLLYINRRRHRKNKEAFLS